VASARSPLAMPQIVAIRTKDDSSRDTISVVLSQDAVCLGPDGQPWSGVSLTAQLARSLAERLLGLAKEIEGQEKPDKLEHYGSQDSFRPLTQVSSILVLHDGSGQGHRAAALALDLASRSLASVQFVGVYGVRQDRLEPSAVPEDYEWHRGWLERLIQMYSQKASHGNVDLQAMLVAASDHERLSEVFNRGGYDLIVLPRRFSDDGAADHAFHGFHQSLAGASESTILFCP
jgi:nucleotide-binding universal stress UspA family protein